MTYYPALRRTGAWVLALLLITGCAGVDARIARNRSAYESWPMAVREKVAAGQIDIGFTPEQVAMALGEPDRVFTRRDADGTAQVWSYRDRGPRIGFGVGVGFGSWGGRGGSFGGVGIGMGTGFNDDEKLGIVFDSGGSVSSIEVRGK